MSNTTCHNCLTSAYCETNIPIARRCELGPAHTHPPLSRARWKNSPTMNDAAGKCSPALRQRSCIGVLPVEIMMCVVFQLYMTYPYTGSAERTNSAKTGAAAKLATHSPPVSLSHHASGGVSEFLVYAASRACSFQGSRFHCSTLISWSSSTSSPAIATCTDTCIIVFMCIDD